jgi:hypothetical protein
MESGSIAETRKTCGQPCRHSELGQHHTPDWKRRAMYETRTTLLQAAMAILEGTDSTMLVARQIPSNQLEVLRHH